MRCSATTAAGKGCRAQAVHGTQLCIRHATNPTLRERALAGSRRGGSKRAASIRQTTASPLEVGDLDLETTSGLRTFLARALGQLARLPFDVRVANAMAQMVNIARAGIEAADLEVRLSQLEERMESDVT
jgi:hypothetical protein